MCALVGFPQKNVSTKRLFGRSRKSWQRMKNEIGTGKKAIEGVSKPVIAVGRWSSIQLGAQSRRGVGQLFL